MPHPPLGPLDPDARVVIDRLNALNAPGYETMPPKTARLIAGHLRRNAAYPVVRVAEVRDLTLGTEAGQMTVRHYRAFRRAQRQPTLIYLHGGGWVLGDLDMMDHLCRSLVRQSGVDVISLDYPLAPESQFPAPLMACAAAVKAIFDEAEALGLDPDRIGIGGDSAGGNLAAVLALTARDGLLPRLAAQSLIYPALDLRMTGLPRTGTSSMFMKPETMEWFTRTYLGTDDAAKDWRASPLLATDLHGLPPTHILTAGHDVLRAQGLDYADRLRAAGATVVLRDYPGQIHNFVAMPYAIPTAHAAIADLSEFLVNHLSGLEGE